MKPLFYIITLSFIVVNHASAQGLGVSAGVFFNTFYPDASETSFNPGFFGGINYEFETGKNTFLKSEIKSISKSFQIKGMPERIKLNYISVPVKMIFKPSLGRTNMLFGGGAYVAYGFSNNKVSYNVFDKDKYGKVIMALKPLDYGFTLITGHQPSQKLRISFNVDMGLANISRDKINPIRTGGFGIDIGYKLMQKKRDK